VLYHHFWTSHVQPVHVALKTLAAQRGGLAANEVEYSEISQQLAHLQKKEKEVNQSLEDTKSSLGTVKDQIDGLKLQQQSLIKKREKKQSRKIWLLKQKALKSGEDLFQVEQLIEEIEESVTELSEKIDELEEKMKALEKETEQTKTQLLKQKREKDELQQKLAELEKQKDSLETTLEEDRGRFQTKLESMMSELRLQEV